MIPRAQLVAGIAALGLALPEGGEEKLLAYLALLEKWNRVYNLTAIRDPGKMVSHHLLDSLAAVAVCDAVLARCPPFSPARGETADDALCGRAPIHVLDAGSGGGLPGIPLAIARPDLHVTLIDTIAKKTAFLTQARGELGLANLAVVTGRVEVYRPETRFNLITSRAFAELALFVNLTRHLLAPGGRWLALKGVHPGDELAALPDGVRAVAVHPLVVPGLDAERCVIELEPT